MTCGSHILTRVFVWGWRRNACRFIQFNTFQEGCWWGWLPYTLLHLWERHKAVILYQIQHHDSALIVAGDFNSTTFKCPLLHPCYSFMSTIWKIGPCCCLSHTYIQTKAEAGSYSSKRGSVLVASLQDALDYADWDRRSSDDTFTEAVMGFVRKVEDNTVHKTIIKRFTNLKPWVDKTICNALRSCSAAYNAGFGLGKMDEYKVPKLRSYLRADTSQGGPGPLHSTTV